MNRRELEQQIQDLFDGSIGDSEFVELQDELRASPEARATYREYLHLHHSLRFRSKGVDLLKVVPMDQVNERRQKRTMIQAALVAAAVIVLAAVVMALVITSKPPPTLTFRTCDGTNLVISHQLTGEELPEGQVLEPGSRLILKHGVVELTFQSGVRGIVRGPADLSLVREDFVDMKKGTVWFEVPSEAVGFQVRTPDLVLTDLGTEFGLISKPDFLDEVHVFTGKVKVLNRYGLKKEEVIEAGFAKIAGPAGRWKEAVMNRSAFLDELPESVPGAVLVDDSASFTSSPKNEVIRQQSYKFTAEDELSGFDAGESDKLVVTISYERAYSTVNVRDVSYGGVKMDLAVHSAKSNVVRTAIYYLDSPSKSGDLVINLSGNANGIGGSIVALSGAALGGPSSTDSVSGRSIRVDRDTENSFIVISHGSNSFSPYIGVGPRLAVEKLFTGSTGSSQGAAGYLKSDSPSPVTVDFSTKGSYPVTVTATFSPNP